MNTKPKSQPAKQVPVRMRPDEIQSLRGFAQLHGRSLSDELRLGMRAHIRRHVLAYMGTAAGAAECREDGHDPAEQEREFRASLARIEDEAFSWPEESRVAVVRAAGEPVGGRLN